jgi:hypothetical protein
MIADEVQSVFPFGAAQQFEVKVNVTNMDGANCTAATFGITGTHDRGSTRVFHLLSSLFKLTNSFALRSRWWDDISSHRPSIRDITTGRVCRINSDRKDCRQGTSEPIWHLSTHSPLAFLLLLPVSLPGIFEQYSWVVLILLFCLQSSSPLSGSSFEL